MDETLRLLCDDVTYFIDQNVNNIAKKMRQKGYKKVLTVFDIGYIGANDGKLFRLIKDNNWLLITRDKRFAKMAKKYGLFVLLIDWSNYEDLSEWGKFIRIQHELIHNYPIIKEKFIKEHYDIVN